MPRQDPRKKRRANRHPDPSEASKLSSDQSPETDRGRFGWFAQDLGRSSYFFFGICVAAQAATILITWPTWQVRQFPVNLPWIEGTPQVSCGLLVMASLGLALLAPRRFGMPIHLGVLFLAIFMDQFRCQPQVLSITVMMMACVWKSIRQLCLWYLVALWLWTGLHKAISPDWYGHVSVLLLKRLNLVQPYTFAFAFALVIAVSEIGHAVLAILKPKIAAFTCVVLHLGILIFLVLINWNYSVIPWNICMATVGCWLLLTASTERSRLDLPNPKWQIAVLVFIMIVPVGFYFGWVRNCFAHVLYSQHLPLAAITRTDDEVERLDGWDDFNFPFPADQAAFLAYFRESAKPGEKLHILEPRQLLKSGYYWMGTNGQISKINETKFFSRDQDANLGIGYDDPENILQLEMAGVRMLKRKPKAMIYAVEFSPEKFDVSLLSLLHGLPNIEQVQLQDCPVEDADLAELLNLPKLTGLGLDQTKVTREGLNQLRPMNLKLIQFEGQLYGSVEAIFDANLE